MSSLHEIDAIFNIAPRLDKFKTVTPSKDYNFRCNVCGDSKKSEHKARAHIFLSAREDIFMFNCFNCGATYSFQYYLKLYFPEEYKDLRARIFKARGNEYHNKKPPKQKEYKVEDIFNKEYQQNLNSILTTDTRLLVPINELSDGHIAYDYLKSRQMNSRAFERLYYTPNFAEFIKEVVPSEIIGQKKLPPDERIVLILQTIDGEIIGFQGRALDPDAMRYMTIMMSETYPKIFGLEHINKDDASNIYVTEGAFDSFFIPNAISVNGGDTNALSDIIESDNIDKNRFVIILDNEPRSKDTIKRMTRTIDDEYNIVIWKGINPEYKDINEMIRSDTFTEESLLEFVNANNFKDTRARVELNFWKKL